MYYVTHSIESEHVACALR